MKKTILIIVLSLIVGVTLYSQDSLSVSQLNTSTVRIAYINKGELLALIPQIAKIETELAQLEDEYERLSLKYGYRDVKILSGVGRDEIVDLTRGAYVQSVEYKNIYKKKRFS